MKNWMVIASIGVAGVVLFITKPWRSFLGVSPVGDATQQPQVQAEEPWWNRIDDIIQDGVLAITGSEQGAQQTGDAVRTAQAAANERMREARQGVGDKIGEVAENLASAPKTVLGWFGM